MPCKRMLVAWRVGRPRPLPGLHRLAAVEQIDDAAARQLEQQDDGLPLAVLPGHQRCSRPTRIASDSRSLRCLRVRRAERSGVQCAAAARTEEGHGRGDALAAGTAGPQRRTNDGRAEGLGHRRLGSGQGAGSGTLRDAECTCCGAAAPRLEPCRQTSGADLASRTGPPPRHTGTRLTAAQGRTARRGAGGPPWFPKWLEMQVDCSRSREGASSQRLLALTPSHPQALGMGVRRHVGTPVRLQRFKSASRRPNLDTVWEAVCESLSALPAGNAAAARSAEEEALMHMSGDLSIRLPLWGPLDHFVRGPWRDRFGVMIIEREQPPCVLLFGSEPKTELQEEIQLLAPLQLQCVVPEGPEGRRFAFSLSSGGLAPMEFAVATEELHAHWMWALGERCAPRHPALHPLRAAPSFALPPATHPPTRPGARTRPCHPLSIRCASRCAPPLARKHLMPRQRSHPLSPFGCLQPLVLQPHLDREVSRRVHRAGGWSAPDAGPRG